MGAILVRLDLKANMEPAQARATEARQRLEDDLAALAFGHGDEGCNGRDPAEAFCWCTLLTSTG